MNGRLLQIALSQYGIAEIPGKNHNPHVLKYFTETGHKWVKDDETSWCSAFMNWVAMKAGAERSGKLDARSWISVGEIVNDREPGDVVVFWRNNPRGWEGHVGLFVKDEITGIYVLGGNQSNMVRISLYPKNSDDYGLLGVRRLRAV